MRRGAALALLILLAGGCYYRPSVMDAGGVRIRTENGRAVRQGADLLVTFDVVSTGAFGDTILGVSSPVAQEAALVNAAGAPVKRLDIPGAVTVKFTPDSTHVVLRAVQKPVERGDTFIVTLLFEKSGGVGVVTLLQ